MLDISSNTTRFEDPLTDMLRGLRLDGVDYGRCELREPWAIHFPAQEAARFHFVGQRACWFLSPSKDWKELAPGDAVLLPRGADHVLASAKNVRPVPLNHYSIEDVSGNYFNVEGGGEGAKTLLFCGSMKFNVDGGHPLLRMMPELMTACALAEIEPDIPPLLDAMTREVTGNRIGSGGIVARLADVLAARIVRAWVERGCGDSSGWLAAVRNPEIGRVLAAIHLKPEEDWNVESLAKLMGASRSGFAERFARLVGETPARYVAEVRMRQAQQWLAQDRLRISVVARKLGYESEASFSRAFKRVIGVAPSLIKAKAK
jgi:AraC-like DNA-binding protein